jgi:putative two-component system response regulator
MKLLVVEDEVASRKKLEVLIKALGYEPLVAQNGQEGWNLWRLERPRIVITDWIMPEMDGLELCRKIRMAEGSQYTYIIMVTAKHDTQDMIQGIDAGADDFVSKPYLQGELAVRIRSGKRVIESQSRDIAIFAISKLAESRNLETGFHLERICYYSKVLADAISRMPDGPAEADNLFVENIFLTSPLHDIGKLGIPDNILLKPSELTSAEFEIMKEHTTIGFNTLNEAAKRDIRAEYLKMSAEIALSHHEKWDGTGYPRGLKETEIPLSARIVALADVYDAIVSKRVYKEASTHEIARDTIRNESGRHFDPMVVEAFKQTEDQFVEIYQQMLHIEETEGYPTKSAG